MDNKSSNSYKMKKLDKLTKLEKTSNSNSLNFQSNPRSRQLQDEQIIEFVKFIERYLSDPNTISANRSALAHCHRPSVSNKILDLIEKWNKSDDFLANEQCSQFAAMWIAYIVKNMEQQVDGFENHFEVWIEEGSEGIVQKRRVMAQTAVFLIQSEAVDLALHEVLLKPVVDALSRDTDARVREFVRQYFVSYEYQKEEIVD